MNRIYKTIWNHASGTATAVSELTAACGKRSSGRSGSLKNAAPRFCLNALAAAMLIIGGQAFAATVSDGTGRNAIVIKGATVGVADPTKNTTAAGQDATAIGTNTTASAQSSFAAGTSAQATQNNALAIGTNAKANGVSASTFGHDATAQTAGDMAFGQGANAQGRSSVNGTAANTITNETYGPAMAQGAFANAQGRNAIAIGNNAKAQGTTASGTVNDVIAIGGNSTASGNRAVALGYKATAGATGQIAIGETTGNTNSQNAVFIGKSAGSGNTSTTGNTNGIAIGNGAGTGMKGGTENVAIGTNSGTAVNGNTNYAIGARAGQTVTGSDNYAMGIEAGRQVTGSQNSTFGYHSGTDITGSSNSAFGRDAGKNIVGSQNLAFGAYAGQYVGATGKTVQDNIAIGTNANKFAAGSELTTSGNTAIGKDSKAQGGNSLALGTSASADKANAVALGANSNTAVAATSVTQATVGGITYNGFAGTNITAGDQVSVGNANYNRQIKHVAAGEISKTSTDAINGSQLYLTQNIIGNMGGSLKTLLGGNAALGTDGKLTMTNIGGTGKNTIHEAIQAANNNANAANAGFKIAANGDASGITADNKTIKPDETLTIKGTGTGAFSNYDSDNIQTQVSADGTVTVGLKKDLTVNSVTAGDSKLDTNGLTITGGPSVTKTGIDAGSKKITNVADGTIGAGSKDAINGGQLHTALSNINNNIAAAKTEVKSSDGSIGVTQGTNAAGATVYDLAVKTDGTTITKAADGSLKANTTALAPAANGSIAAPSAADAGKLVNAGDIANAINQAGFNLTTSASTGAVSGSSVERVNAGKTVTIDAGKNIRISQNGGTVSIATQDNASFDSVTTGNTKIDNNGLTINGGPSVTQSGIDAGGNKITNVAPGTDPTDAVNVSQLNARLGATGQVAEEKLRQLEHKMDQNQDRANAGIAGAIAQGTIPQVTRPSAFGLGVGTGYYGGQSALAVGASAMTDGGNWIFKGNFSVNTKGRVGAGAGALYQW